MSQITPEPIEGFYKEIICPFCGGMWDQVVHEHQLEDFITFKCARCLRKIIVEEKKNG